MQRRILSAIANKASEACSVANRLLLAERGFVPFVKPFSVLGRPAVDKLRARLPLLFHGEFDTGVYPDEMHRR